MVLSHAPEKRGSSAMVWATPMVNGLVMAAEKPKAIGRRLIPRPVIESHPRMWASGMMKTMSGTMLS